MCLIENGNSYPSLETFVKIARVLEININEFFNIASKPETDDVVEIIDMIKSIDRKKLPLVYDLLRVVAKHR